MNHAHKSDAYDADPHHRRLSFAVRCLWFSTVSRFPCFLPVSRILARKVVDHKPWGISYPNGFLLT
jgi:hypothetical protein